MNRQRRQRERRQVLAREVDVGEEGKQWDFLLSADAESLTA